MAALRAAGAPPEVIEQCSQPVSEQLPTTDFDVWAENWASLEVFLDLATCWTWLSGFTKPIRVGIPATELEATLRLHGINKRRRRLIAADVRLMEDAALDQMSSSRARE